RAAGQMNSSTSVALPVAAGVDDEPLGHSQIPVQRGRVADLPIGRIVVGDVQREPIGRGDIGGSQAAGHLASRHPVRVASIEVHLVVLGLDGSDGVGQHPQPSLPRSVTPAVGQPSERVRLEDHDRWPATQTCRKAVNPLLVRLLIAFEPTIRRMLVTNADEQNSKHDEQDKLARRDYGHHSPTDPRKPSHGWEYSTIITGLTSHQMTLPDHSHHGLFLFANLLRSAGPYRHRGAGLTGSLLQGVAIAGSQVWAVGQSDDASGRARPLVEHLDHGKWTAQFLSGLGSPFSNVTGV